MFKKVLILVFMLVLVMLVVAACGPGGGGGGANAGRSVNITASEFQFAPNAINAKPGEKITVTLKNAGSVQHTFDLKEANFRLTAEGGKDANGSFTAPTAPGTYKFVCDVPGHAEAGMEGQLVVQ